MLDKKEITVLLVEDNPGDVLLIKHFVSKISSLKINLVWAEQLSDAFDKLQIHAIDLILLDLLLPDSTDSDTFIRVNEQAGAIPIIVLSGINDSEVALQAIKDGAQDYLVKGDIELKLLEKSIRYAIERNKLTTEQLFITRELQSRADLLKLITRISTTFINFSSEQISEAILQSLALVGTFLEADLTFILELNEGNGDLRNFYEWHLPSQNGKVAHSGTLGKGNDFGWAMNDLKKIGVLSYNTSQEFPLTAEKIKSGELYVESLLLVAVYYERKMTGVFGLASKQKFKVWNEETLSLLNPTGEIIYRAIKKKQAEEKIKESEKNYRVLVENMSEGLVYADQEGIIQFVNTRVSQMLGFSREELTGQTLDSTIFFDKYSKNYLEKAEETPKIDGESVQYEAPIRTKNGKYVWMLVNSHPIVEESGKMVGTMATLINISDRKKAEEKLTRVNQELKTFIYRASHDLRGPLASVLGLTNVAQMQVRDEEALKYFEHIRTSTFKLDRTLKALTDVASITQSDEDFDEIDFTEIINDSIAIIKDNENVRNKVDFDIHVQQTQRFRSNRQVLKHVLGNLLDNSVKFCKEHRPLVLAINVEANDEDVHIEVRDNGIGIPAELQNRVFDMFFRGHAHSQGSGLGLYVVDKLVNSLNGDIRITSVEGEGTSFFIHLQNKR